MAEQPLVEVEGLTRSFHLGGRTVRAVDGVSFKIGRGETLALVGESGCGKTTTGRLLVRLVDPESGRITFDGVDMAAASGAGLRAARRRMQMIFQDPGSSFNPRMKVASLVTEPMQLAGLPESEQRARLAELLPLVGLAADYAGRYPHEFSGGQRQRIGIARALALRPDFIVCDEPVSALDVSVQAQVVNLLTDVQHRFGLTYLFISHDLRVVRHVANEVAVMYLGRIVEHASKASLYRSPRHPYTRALLSAVPSHRPGMARRTLADLGEIASADAIPSGCRFHTRCPYAVPLCREIDPPMSQIAEDHRAACHRLESIPP
ncbi:ABC transporter ATP-binding protein [Roseomonas sp. WA12]